MSYVESEMHHIPILDDIRLPFLSHLPRFFGFQFRSKVNKILVRDRLGADESLLEIGVNHACCLRCRPSLMDRPRADFLRSCGEVREISEPVVGGADQSVQAGL